MHLPRNLLGAARTSRRTEWIARFFIAHTKPDHSRQSTDRHAPLAQYHPCTSKVHILFGRYRIRSSYKTASINPSQTHRQGLVYGDSRRSLPTALRQMITDVLAHPIDFEVHLTIEQGDLCLGRCQERIIGIHSMWPLFCWAIGDTGHEGSGSALQQLVSGKVPLCSQTRWEMRFTPCHRRSTQWTAG